jgi:hypothetical protein
MDQNENRTKWSITSFIVDLRLIFIPIKYFWIPVCIIHVIKLERVTLCYNSSSAYMLKPIKINYLKEIY